MTQPTIETRSFQAHTKKLLDLMIHSIYSQKDVFLRELISNASDAIDKVRFEALTNPELATDGKIKLVPDAAAHTLTITDNGIGMTWDEVVEHIGTIAKSGSEAYAEKLKELGKDAAAPDLIGQFGVGFYSAFIVSDEVTLETCKYGESDGVRWHSKGDGEYTIERIPARAHGTTVTLHLRAKETDEDALPDSQSLPDGEHDFTNAWTLRKTVKKYSDFIAYPIVLDVEKHEAEKDADGNAVKDGKIETKIVEETINSMKALWTRAPGEVTTEEHNEFYKHLTHDWSAPQQTLHFHVEGNQEFTALLYVPEKAPSDLYAREQKRGLQLYIKRVFIAAEVKELIPEYFRFMRGLVDSSDLPLNVSREVVQQGAIVARIKRTLTTKLINFFKDLLAKDRTAYEGFWAEYGQAIKEAFHYEPAVKDKIAEIVLVRTTNGDSWSTLAEVVERMKEGQEALYYLTGEKFDVLREAPQLEVFAKKQVEVILLGDAVDEIFVATLEKYREKELKSAARGELEGLPETAEDKVKQGEQADKFAGLLAKLKELLAEDLADVRLTARLTDSAACLVADEGGMSPQLERMLAAMGQPMPDQKRILELNPDHAVVDAMAQLATKPGTDERLKDFGEMLIDQALIAEGSPVKHPARFAKRVTETMARAALGV
jgi:molecular chaperone HtpG